METLSNKRQQHGGNKQSLTNKRPRRSDSPAAAGSRWLILNSCVDNEGGDSSPADAQTTAASFTSSGKAFSISFGIAAPPACCSLHFAWIGGGTTGDSDGKHSKSQRDDALIIAGHDDALLIKIKIHNPEVRHGQPPTITFDDYFLYEAGGGARPPSLSLLPVFRVPVQVGLRNHSESTPRFRYLAIENIGILRRGEDDDLVVCQLEMTCDPPIYSMADICMLRVGRDHKWIVRRLPIVEHREGSSELQPWRWSWWQNPIIEAAVPVGNRFLCWVHYSSCFILCDMADEETPKLRYVPLPATHVRCCRTLGAAGPDKVRFVSVTAPPYSSVGCLGKTSSEGSSSSFNVTTWTMTLSTEEGTTWVKDVVLDCDDIWKCRPPNYGCHPCDKHVEYGYPMVSSDDPDVIYFKVEGMAVEINMRSKKLLSVVPSGTRDQHMARRHQRSITAKLCW